MMSGSGCKSPKLPGANFPAVKKSDRRPPIDVASIALPGSPARFSSDDEVPHKFTWKSPVQPKEILIASAKPTKSTQSRRQMRSGTRDRLPLAKGTIQAKSSNVSLCSQVAALLCFFFRDGTHPLKILKTVGIQWGAGIVKEGVYGAVGDFNPATSHGVIQDVVQLRNPTKVLNAVVSPVRISVID